MLCVEERKSVNQAPYHHIRVVFLNLTGGYNSGRIRTVNQVTKAVDCAIQLPSYTLDINLRKWILSLPNSGVPEQQKIEVLGRITQSKQEYKL